MINHLPVAIALFILLNYIDQVQSLQLGKDYRVYLFIFISHVLLCVYYSNQFKLARYPFIKKIELKVLVSSLLLDPLWLAEIFKPNLEYQSIGAFGLFLIINGMLSSDNVMFSIGCMILPSANPLISVFTLLLFWKELVRAQKIKLILLSAISLIIHIFYLKDFNLNYLVTTKSQEFWLYYKLSSTRFQPYYSLISITLIGAVLLLRNRRIPQMHNLIYKLTLISIILKSMSVYKFDACFLQIIFYSLTLINKNLFFIPIYSSFVFLVVYPKIYKSWKIGIVIAASYVLFVGVLTLLSSFYKNHIFRQQRILMFLFSFLPITIVVFSFFGGNIVLLILQESFELFYLLLIFITILVIYLITNGEQEESFWQSSVSDQ
ncbi:Transmembrane domain-containing protein [Spironucleus salmonicida]|uniref:Transmembrane domain-containing protein n=1 Tax=Spironucleus salmonicida TaxID=348837 RepID=A0A9P8LN97_9EUKA|nr:Transmembrane domain-containing protein [Spironucleus salmonicida]KAH0571230.1 Transmembrane domain-containing protein [Spironucleus salmonicida]